MSRLLAGLFLLVNCLIPPLAGAQQASVEQSGYFAPERSGCANDNGWHFYCDPKKQAKQSSQKKAPATPTTIPASPSAPEALPSLPTAREQLDSVGKQLEELKARAILEPTEANIHAYASYQEQQLSLAHSFADQWRRVLWRNPELDYNLVAPQGTQGKRAWVDQRRQAQRLTLARLQDRYGVFFFYTTSCVYCTVYSLPLSGGLSKTTSLCRVFRSMDTSCPSGQIASRIMGNF